MAFQVLIVDDQELVRRMLRFNVEAHPALDVCGEAETGGGAIELAFQRSPDVVILDNEMPVQTGMEALPVLRRALPDRVIVMYSSLDSAAVATQALDAGADAYLLKGEQSPADVVAFVAERVSVVFP